MYSNARIGNVVLNNELPIDKQIKEALRTNRVTVLEYDGSIKQECPVLNFQTSDLIFPKEYGKLGSSVMLLQPYGSHIPIVVGIIPDMENKNNTIIQNEYQKKFLKQSENCVVSFSEDAENGNIIISILGLKPNKSNFKINVGSVENDAKAEISVQGEMKIISTKKLDLIVNEELNLNIRNLQNKEKFNSLKYKLGEGLTIVDEFENTIITKSDKIQIQSKYDINLESENNINVKSEKEINVNSPSVKIEGGGKVTIGKNPKPITGFCAQTICPVVNIPLTTNEMPSE